MKATGIVRRIDDLGRVVVPKEIRRTMRIREGQAMEIYTGREGEIILKKYSPIEELAECAAGFTKSISTVTGCLVCVSDQEQIVVRMMQKAFDKLPSINPLFSFPFPVRGTLQLPGGASFPCRPAGTPCLCRRE